MKGTGIVYLVGAGPGDPGLLTTRGAELLAKADVVIYDALVNADLLRLAPATAERIFAGKRAAQHAIPQDKLNALLVEKAKEGKCVVRLKGGDPYIFGRGGEEAQELAAAKVAFEVVPGVSSISAVPNYAGIPLTHRDHCSSFTVLTGHEDPTKDASALDLEQLARSPGTKVILMGVERIRALAEGLTERGLPSDTPVAMIRWGTTGQQQTLVGTLKNIADQVEKTKFSAPAVTVIGGVVTLRQTLNWFERRRLFAKRIVVTRTREQASQLSHRLMELGADVLEIPTIRVVLPDNLVPLSEVLAGLNAYDWIVFTSPNGVRCFFDAFFKVHSDLRDIGGLRIAAVGPATAAEVKAMHLAVDAMPEQYLTEKIAKAIAKETSIENLRILLLRAQKANPELPKTLEDLGAIVDDVPVYKTIAENEDTNGAVARFQEGGADWITFTSSSTVEHFHARFDLPKVTGQFPKLRLASIGPETSKALKALSLEPALEAKEHTIEGLVKALLKAG
jgi:uroporphyrinogen III methyltransferase/synthase